MIALIWVALAATPTPLDVEQCVAVAIETSAKVEEAEAKVKEWKARLFEVESLYYPKVFGMAFIAPMYKNRIGDLSVNKSNSSVSKFKNWGPYVRLEATLAQPIFSFGRIEAGTKASEERVEVEKARVREARNLVALEVRKLYYLYLYARSMKPSLTNAAAVLVESRAKAEEMYEDATGDVTQVDLMKLAFGAAEIDKFRVKADAGEKLALAALKHTMGWPAEHTLVLKEKRLSKKLPQEDPDLAAMMHQASENRPEWDQVRHGKKATIAWADAEALARLPVVFLAGQFKAAWTPVREDAKNAYLFDPYNEVFGGVALGLQFNIDHWGASARTQIAEATHDQVVALGRFAATGIPMQVKKAHNDVVMGRELAELSADSAKATKKWLTFAAAAFMTGTGEAKDVLEGLASYLQAKNGQYEAIRDYQTALAELTYAVGKTTR